jgi:hypothetical protein
MVDLCASIPGWSVILNADIVVGRELPEIVRRMAMRRGTCAISSRWEFESDPIQSKVVDRGLDFFVAHQSAWIEVGKIFPPELRIGHSLWDTIMLACFNIVDRNGLFDLTHHRVVFHPKHGNRYQPHRIPDSSWSEFRHHVAWPSRRLR